MSALPDVRPALVECETVIERGLATFVEVGAALLRIRDDHLYRDDYQTFEDYCRERWQFSDSRARQLVGAVETVTTVTVGGLPAPSSERVTRELHAVPQEERQQTWAEVVDLHGDKPTAAQVKEVVETKRPTAALMVQSAENEWYTPARYIEHARAVLGAIDLDPASCHAANQTVRAAKFYSIKVDGLRPEWTGRVWLNPPYGRLAGDFTRKLLAEYEAGRVPAAIALVNAHCTDTGWFGGLWDHALCFTDHRIDFDSERGKQSSSTHGSVFAYLGPDPAKFADIFSAFGAVVSRWPS